MITADRWQHILGVARQAQKFAACLYPTNPQFAQDMFLLGILHDFGYEFATADKPHAPTGGEILARNGYRYSAEVANHGDPDIENMSDALFILNCADMTVGPAGQTLTMDERLADIGERYGTNSPAYLNAQTEMHNLQTDHRYPLLQK